MGMMTRVNPQFEKTRKNPARRALQGSQWGMVCPSDTPEGENCGLTKNLALMTHITTDKDADPVARIAFDLGVEDLGILAGDELFNGKNALVFVNGMLLLMLSENRKQRKRGRGRRGSERKGEKRSGRERKREEGYIWIQLGKPRNCCTREGKGEREGEREKGERESEYVGDSVEESG